ncbi:hypothetical protein BU17DRAFT_63145 [Hysterangium stoloniferum]|nr:hypothetical protein BU17DRAFT_63145 [Hysterangium stoloniferum]
MESIPDPYAFSATPILSYLGLPPEYEPSPQDSPVDFLTIHLRQLPPNLLALFSRIITPQRRTVLPIIRNRRQKYASTVPRELALPEARKRWPMLWVGREREKPGLEQGKEEKRWAEREFLGGVKGQVGKLGQLLSEYEEEREAERMREVRREKMAEKFAEQNIEEEEEEEEGEGVAIVEEEQESTDQLEINFERVVREKFIYGLLDDVDYDPVDWDDKWDETDERDAEERWFDEEEEEDAPPDTTTIDS